MRLPRWLCRLIGHSYWEMDSLYRPGYWRACGVCRRCGAVVHWRGTYYAGDIHVERWEE